MFVRDDGDVVDATVRGHRYVFCSEGCKRRFTAPERELTRLKQLAAFALGLGAVVAFLTHQDLAGLTLLGEPALGWTLLVLGTAVQAVAGLPFYRGLAEAVKQRSANVDTLVAIGTTAAWLFGAIEVVSPELLVAASQSYYFEVSALVLGFLLVGRTIEHRFRRDASEEVRRLMELQPEMVRVVEDGEEREVRVEEVEAGTEFRVGVDERIPLDGVVVDGSGAVDEAMVTGESLPVDKKPGDKVIGGTENVQGELLVKATRPGSESTVSKIIHLMEDAKNASPPIQRFVDKVTSYYVPVVIVIAVSAFTVGRLGLLPFAAATGAFAVLIAVLLVGCPTPLGLATPAAVEAGLAEGADEGLLLKGGEFMEILQQVDMVVFDKTGTLTEGRPSLTDVLAVDGDEDDVLALAASVEQRSDHPLAKAILTEARDRDLELSEPTDVEVVAGAGVIGTVDGETVRVGSTKLLDADDVDLVDVDERAGKLEDAGKTVILVTRGDDVVGLVAFQDRLRDDARDAVTALQDKGLDVALMTGDHARTAQAIGAELGLGKRRSFAELTPDDKVALIKSLQGGDRVVAMVGDGINDAPALAAADVGIAVGSGSDVVVEAGDIVLMRDDLRDVPRAIEIGERTLEKIKQNLGWAFAYNAILIPIAAIGLLNPLLAGILMAFSTVPVVANSIRTSPEPTSGEAAAS